MAAIAQHHIEIYPHDLPLFKWADRKTTKVIRWTINQRLEVSGIVSEVHRGR